jgi:FdhD protein
VTAFPRPSRYSQAPVQLLALENGAFVARDDLLATEAPLEIRIAGAARPIVTMRTPGHDPELALGLLHAEGVIRGRDDVLAIHPLSEGDDVLRVVLAPAARARAGRLQRSLDANSACGVCGKTRIDPPASADVPPLPAGPQVDIETLLRLPAIQRASQPVFRYTGGLHAAALFDAAGELLVLREDVGRHNALDKLVGWALLCDRLPLHGHLVLLSGRASYELVQKCALAAVPILCAVSAPSSLAVELARRFRITLIGFLRGERFNLYSAPGRIRGLGASESGSAIPGGGRAV